jgi:hypothetical protein
MLGKYVHDRKLNLSSSTYHTAHKNYAIKEILFYVMLNTEIDDSYPVRGPLFPVL